MRLRSVSRSNRLQPPLTALRDQLLEISLLINQDMDAIARVTVQDRTLPSSLSTLQEEDTERDRHLHVTVSGRVNTHLGFDEPLTVVTSKGEKQVTGIGFWADEPADVAAKLRRRDPEPPRHRGAPRAPFRA